VELPGAEIAKLCQAAENEFIGAQSGIMDPFASACGVEGHALLLDCRSLAFEPLPLPETVVLVIANSMVKHSLSGDDSYNRRRREVDEGARILQTRYPEIQTLRDADEEQLRSMAGEMPETVFRRCLHVITENARVLQAADALRRHDFAAFGRRMLEAHASMRDNYEASCAETDTLVRLAMEQPGCHGARITGAGFGGCTVNLVAAGAAEDFVENLGAGYERETGIRATIYRSRASAGAGPLSE
jgi:galactokinase